MQLTNAGKDKKETDAPAKNDSGKNKKSVVGKKKIIFWFLPYSIRIYYDLNICTFIVYLHFYLYFT